MEQRLTPDVFCGSAVAALCGILMGLLLHGPWHKHPGGPQIWSASPAAEALAQPPRDNQALAETEPAPEAQAVAPEAQAVADVDTGYVTPDPLPVTPLDPERFEPRPAAAEAPQREDVEAAQGDDADDEVADAASSPQPDPS